MGVFMQPPFWASERRAPRWPRISAKLVTPGASVLTPTEAKLGAKIETTYDDTLVPRWIAAAQRKVENDTSLALLTQTWDLALDGFPSTSWIDLPIGPLQSVLYAKFYDSSDVLQTIDVSQYLTDLLSIRGRIALSDIGVWPTDLRSFQPGIIRVVVGWTQVSDIPAELLMAVHLVFGWLAMNREPGAFEREAYDELIGPYTPVSV